MRFSHGVSALTRATSTTSPSRARTLRGLAHGADGHLAEASVLELPGDLRGDERVDLLAGQTQPGYWCACTESLWPKREPPAIGEAGEAEDLGDRGPG